MRRPAYVLTALLATAALALGLWTPLAAAATNPEVASTGYLVNTGQQKITKRFNIDPAFADDVFVYCWMDLLDENSNTIPEAVGDNFAGFAYRKEGNAPLADLTIDTSGLPAGQYHLDSGCSRRFPVGTFTEQFFPTPRVPPTPLTLPLDPADHPAAAPAVTGTPPAPTLGDPYSYALLTAGAPPPVVTTSDPLPQGLALSSGGVISGTPTEHGTFPVTVTASNGVAPDATHAFTLEVGTGAPEVTGTPPTLHVGEDVEYQFTVTGTAPVTVAVDGTLPDGLSLGEDALLIGVPEPGSEGDYPLTLTPNNGIFPTSPHHVTITVAGERPANITGHPGPAVVGIDYWHRFDRAGSEPSTFALADGSAAPPGLTLASDGVLSGTPAELGQHTFTVTAANGVPPDAAETFTLDVAAGTPPSIDGTMSPFVVGKHSQFSFRLGGNPAPFLSLSGALPTGLQFDEYTSRISGIPQHSGEFPLTVTATNDVAPSATREYILVVQPAAVAPPSLIDPPIDGYEGVEYQFLVEFRGYSTAPTVEVTGGDLPPGLTLSAAGELAGRPTQVGEYPFTLTASNGVEADAMVEVTLRILDPNPAISGTPPPLAVGQHFDFLFTVTGDPTPSVTTSDPLPPGVILEPWGYLYGIVELGSAETYNITVTASNGVGADATHQVTLEVDTGAPTISGTPRHATEGKRYRFDYTLTGIPDITTTVTGGQLPDGLHLSPSGVLSGVPTTPGTYGFTVTATNPAGESSVVTEMTVAPATPTGTAPTIGNSPPNGIVGVGYTHTFEVGGEPAPELSITDGELPPGLTLDGNTLAGTPTALGNYQFTVTAANSVGTTDLDASVQISRVEKPKVTSAKPPNGAVGQPYPDHAFTATGAPEPEVTAAVTTGTLPDGMTLNGTVLSGTPTTAGTFKVTATATNTAGTTTKTYTVKVTATKPKITSPAPPRGTVDAPYTHTFTATGAPEPEVTAAVTTGTLPDGMTLNGTVLSGTPTTAGTFKVTATATNTAGTTTKTYTVRIR